MAWLTGWSKRLKMEIDELRIDENLTDFPVMVALSSGTGINSFNTADVFDTITPISGTLFSEDFTASGTNWTHETGTTSYTSGYWKTSSVNGTDRTTNSYDFGEYFDVKFKFYANYANGVYVQICYDTATTNYVMQINIVNSSSNAPPHATNNISIYKKNGPTATTVILDGQWNMYTEGQTATNWFWARACREGTKLYAKFWKNPSPEPTTWNYEVENVYSSSWPTTGVIRLLNGGGSYESGVDDILIRKHYPITTSKKLAMTSSDGVTQLPVEVEYWDQYDKKAYLWTKVPTVYSGTNTSFYLYYDANQIDNVAYVGYTDSTPAQNVWDSDYVLVCHMNVNPGKGYVKDSTAYNVDSTAFSPDYNNWQLTQVGLSYTFNNSESDRIEFGANNPATNISGALTVENVYKLYSGDINYARGISCKGLQSASRESWSFVTYGAATGPYSLSAYISNTGASVPSYAVSTTQKFDLNVWYYGALRFNPSTETMIWVNNGMEAINISSVPSSLYVPGTPATGNDTLYAGLWLSTTGIYRHLDGEMSEFRISKTVRSDAWLKATYYTCFNQFLFFASEAAPSYYYQGYVKERGSVVARAVKLYRRSTGVLIDYTTSASGNGYYYLTTPYNEDHFVVAFDDDAGDEYNALILDRLDPTGIV